MLAASRGYVLAAAAFAATSAVVVTPAVPRPSQVPVRHLETRLVDAESVLNIPVNLFDDIANIPYTELQGFNVLGDSLLFSGDWWVPSATNLWGTDPGDLGHYMGLLDVLIPFPQISGLDQPEIDPTADASGTAGLAQQIGLLAAAELPTSASCDAETCFPMTPPNIITGSTSFDRDIGFLQALSGNATTQDGSSFSLFSDWLKVPLSDLTNGYTFGSSDTGIVDPSPNATNGGGVLGEFGFPGTTGTGGTAGDMPWDGVTFKLNLLGPFQDFYNSLLATPSTSGIDGTGIDLPGATDLTQSVQNFLGGLVVAFDPFVEGSPACPAACDLPASDTQLGLMQDILALDPSNQTIAQYVANFPDNNATITEAEQSVALLQTGEYNLSLDNLLNYDALLAQINPELPVLFTNAGIVTDPNYVEFANGTAAFDPTYGGYNPYAELGDYYTLLTNNEWNFGALATDLSNPNTLYYLFDPASENVTTGTTSLAGAATDLSGGLGGFDPSTLSTDLTSLLSGLGTTAGAETLSQLVSELGTQLATDLGAQLPASLATLF
ncbi:hypothetical protein GCM10009641_72170 [Mycobacterium cookii]|uniref:PE-PPE domain-containing protein n=1 Tax=Mycobacterium cookii TaxID=1775 RepID=A0A7I7KVF9_9MYCO|nr:hypothetical protein [Mycobacterium cookii]MCV7331451.1 hypothetical protein [Mycobacterium cookii]BBX45804.1 hypothetical protein MCOO_18190 [Mycobacterium cookii]